MFKIQTIKIAGKHTETRPALQLSACRQQTSMITVSDSNDVSVNHMASEVSHVCVLSVFSWQINDTNGQSVAYTAWS